MARIRGKSGDKVYKISRFLGVNEAEEGQATLKSGEAAFMKNFRITEGGALQKRGGTAVVAGLLSAYTVQEGQEEVLYAELGPSARSFVMYPTAEIDSGGRLVTKGEAFNMNNENYSEHIGSYYIKNGEIYKFLGKEEKQI